MCDGPVGRRIVFPVDSSSNCQRAFNWFVKYAYRPNDFVYFAHAMQPKMVGKTSMAMPMEHPTTPMQTEYDFLPDLNEATSIVAKYTKMAENAGIAEFTTKVLADSSAAEAILSMAADCQANLIVVGSLGTSNFRRTRLGAVSRHLVTHSTLPILLVPPIPRKISVWKLYFCGLLFSVPYTIGFQMIVLYLLKYYIDFLFEIVYFWLNFFRCV